MFNGTQFGWFPPTVLVVLLFNTRSMERFDSPFPLLSGSEEWCLRFGFHTLIFTVPPNASVLLSGCIDWGASEGPDKSNRPGQILCRNNTSQKQLHKAAGHYKCYPRQRYTLPSLFSWLVYHIVVGQSICGTPVDLGNP